MNPNDTFRSLRYLLNAREAKLVEIAEMAGYLITEEEVTAYLKHEDEPGYLPCPDEALAHFLNGLVIFKRGRDETRPPQPIEVPVTNNTVLKKLRVAYELKDVDLIEMIERSGTLKVTKSELSAFFRGRDHRNYRECGDQYLRNLLKVLSS